MMMTTGDVFMGAENGPVSPSNYKRAVIKPPPREFTVEVLCPTKHGEIIPTIRCKRRFTHGRATGSNYSYGLKICPIIRSRTSSDSRSTFSYSEYEIWRRWEDCLDFQETLEDEYGKMSRQKVKVLKRGATGKKRNNDTEGLYSLRNAAASFESLPEGPDPREVAVDVHKLIPQLTRKGTFFRVSHSTVNQRGDEFAAMIGALFNSSEDAPVLLQELRNCSPVRDFFGIWRRDKDLLKKSGKDVSRMFHSNHSLSSFSTASNYSAALPSPTSSIFSTPPSSPAALSRHSMFSRSGSRGGDSVAPSSLLPASAPPGSCSFLTNSPPTSQFPDTSQDDQHLPAEGGSPGSMLFTDELLLQDEGIVEPGRRPLGHFPPPRSAPPIHSAWKPSQTSHTAYNPPIPEDELPKPQPRARSNSSATPGYRNARIFVSPPTFSLPPPRNVEYSSLVDVAATLAACSPNPYTAHLPPVFSETSSHSAAASSPPSSLFMNRFSITSSISSYTQASKRSSSSHDSVFSCDSESCVDMTSPNSTLSQPRNSTSSFASFRTQASADGVIPLHLHDPVTEEATPASISRPQSTLEQPVSGYEDDFLDSYFSGTSLSMECLNKELPHFVRHGGKLPISSISSGCSSASSTESQQLWLTPDDAFAVKAIYNESVIVFRAERSMSLAIIRQKIKDRFALHEHVPLAVDFTLGYIPSRTPIVNGRRGRSNSMASSTSHVSKPRLLQTELDWQAAMAACNGKVTLCVLDTHFCF